MNVLVTGVSKGIGNSILNILIQHPEISTIYACTSNFELNTTFNNKVKLIHLDFLNNETWKNLKETTLNIPIHILINNAGYLTHSPFELTTENELKKIFEINFFAPYQLIQKMLPNLKTGNAHVVNIGSMGGFQGSSKFSGLSAYSASKAALSNLTECLAGEFSSENIKFNCLALGAVDTEMLKKAFPSYKSNISSDQIAKNIVDFALNWGGVINGKVIPLSFSTP